MAKRSISGGFQVAVLVLVAWAGGARAEPAATALAFSQPTVDAGEVYQFGVLDQRFDFTNATDHDVRITGIQAGDPTAKVEPQTGLYAPGHGGTIRVRQPLGPRLGEATFRFTVSTDDPVHPAQELVLSTFIQSAYDRELPFLDFGDVDRSRGKTLPFEVATREADAVDLVAVAGAPDFVEIARGRRTGVAGEGLELTVTLKPEAPLGLQVGAIHLRTNVPQQPDYLVRFRASVFGDVVPDTIPLELGVVRVGDAFSARLQLNSRSGRAFRVGDVRDSRGWLAASAAPCAGGGGPSDCWIVTAGQTPVRVGRLDGVLEAQVDGQPLPLAYAGLVAARDATFGDLGEVDSGVRSERTVDGGGDGR